MRGGLRYELPATHNEARMYHASAISRRDSARTNGIVSTVRGKFRPSLRVTRLILGRPLAADSATTLER